MPLNVNSILSWEVLPGLLRNDLTCFGQSRGKCLAFFRTFLHLFIPCIRKSPSGPSKNLLGTALRGSYVQGALSCRTRRRFLHTRKPLNRPCLQGAQNCLSTYAILSSIIRGGQKCLETCFEVLESGFEVNILNPENRD